MTLILDCLGSPGKGPRPGLLVGQGTARLRDSSRRPLAFASVILLMLLSSPLHVLANYSEATGVDAGGGGGASVGPYSLTDTASQPCVGSASSPSYNLDEGFWYDINSPLIGGAPASFQLTNMSSSISIANLLWYVQDPDGDPLALVAVDSTSALGGTLTVNNGKVYYQPPSGVFAQDSFNYTVSDSEGESIVCTAKLVRGSPGPVLISSSDELAHVLLPFTVTNSASGLNPPLTYGLGPGAPEGMRMNPVDGMVFWTPARAQARSTNVFTVWVTDSSSPRLGATNSLTVAVDDFVELSLGEAAAQVGDSNSLPVTLQTSASLTNLQALVQLPENRLGSPALTGWGPGIAGAALLQENPGTWRITVSAATGQTLPKEAVLARLSFVALSNSTAVVPLSISGMTNLATNGTTVARNLANPGRVIIVGQESLLEMTPATNGPPSLVLYGQRGASLKIDASQDLSASGGPWQPVWQGTVPSNLRVTLPGPANGASAVFFRALQTSGR